jgi:hypothetical protein
MDQSIDHLKITADDFARRFAMRTSNLMWLLGAGASAAAGIPTAGQMIWEFKQRLFVSQRKVSPKAVADLANPIIRNQIQAHIDSSGTFPAFDTPEEYAVLFETAYPSESDRRLYIDSKIKGAKPSYGHMALATLMKSQLTRIVWTTNFDCLIADASATIHESTEPLSVVALDAPELAEQLIGDGRWPIEVKLHGDFRSRRLKNTNDELRHQDSRLRSILVDSCRRFGLVVGGYSGRDDSVMDALEEAITDKNAFPAGLFWLHRGDWAPMPRVCQLLAKANSIGAEAHLVTIDNFDEILRDLIRLTNGLDTTKLDSFATARSRWSAAPKPAGNKGWPVLRFNAIAVTQAPTICRRVVCGVGGLKDARDAVAKVKAQLIVSRTRAGVLCFGSDSEVRKAFEDYGIQDFDIHPIESNRLWYDDTGEHCLVSDAIVSAIARERHLDVFHKRGLNLLAPRDVQNSALSELKSIVGSLSGSVKDSPHLHWREGVGVRLEWACGQLWLLFEPTTVFEPFEDRDKTIVADFCRERTVKRYNPKLNRLFDFWSRYLAGDGREIRALGIGDGIDAVYRLSNQNAYSRRATT